MITAKIESNQMDLDLLIPKGERSPIRDFLESLAATSKVQATASIARGQYKHLKFGSLSARITIQDGMLDLDRVSGQSTNGEVAGRIVVQLPRKQPAEAEISVRATGLLVEDVLKLAGDKGARNHRRSSSDGDDPRPWEEPARAVSHVERQGGCSA